MRRPRSLFRPLPAIVSLAMFSWFVGCGSEEPVGDIPYPQTAADDDDDGTGGTSGVSSVGVGPTGTSASSSTGSGSGSTSSSTGATTSSSIAATTTTTTGGGGDDICQPDGDDLACVSCVKESCCLEVQDCGDEDSCICWVECIKDTLGAIDQCILDCGAPGGGLLDLLDCGGLECEAECGNIGL